MAENLPETKRSNTYSKLSFLLEGWSKADKFKLYQSLKIHGSLNVPEILKDIPTKSVEEVNKAITYYKSKALTHPTICQRRYGRDRLNRITQSHAPLASWAKFLTDSLSFEELENETNTAVKLISELENYVAAICTENVEFKKIYEMIGNAMEGKSLPEDPYAAAILEKCITETALTSKAFMRYGTYKQLIENINVSEKYVTDFTKPTNQPELIIIQDIATQKAYNPLNIEMQYLKSS